MRCKAIRSIQIMALQLDFSQLKLCISLVKKCLSVRFERCDLWSYFDDPAYIALFQCDERKLDALPSVPLLPGASEKLGHLH